MQRIANPGPPTTWMSLAGDTMTGEGVDAGQPFPGEQDIHRLTVR
ncbi:hypothetical protein ACFY5D_11645 [Paeniglutamicibacter sp. NPDC012692]